MNTCTASTTLLVYEFRTKALSFSPFRFHHPISRCKSPTKCCGLKTNDTHKPPQGFSVLKSDVSCDIESTWSTMAFYMFTLHVPLSFSGLSAVSKILNSPVLDPQTEILSLFVIQSLELTGSLLLLSSTMEPQSQFSSFFHPNIGKRNWLLASAIGFGLLVLVVFVTSILADILIGRKDVNNPILKEILSSGSLSVTACILVYCFLTPLLEEIIYRGFLLTSLSSSMKWQHAVILSSAIFSAAHFSADNFLQLCIIGVVLGCSYCWTGNLTSSIAIHSLYNALTLLITYTS